MTTVKVSQTQTVIRLIEPNEIVELWVQGKGRFVRNPDQRIDLDRGVWFQSGSFFSDGVEIVRVVKAKHALSNYSLPGWAVIRKDHTQLVAHTFYRELVVGTIPHKTSDHDYNRKWFQERIEMIMSANMATWNKFRTAIAVRKTMRDYEKVYGAAMPGPTGSEVGLLTQMKIIPEEDLKSDDIERISAAYAKLYGPKWMVVDGVS